MVSLIPIGIIDAAFTLAAVSIYGIEVEINPFVRIAFSSGNWLAWVVINIVAFSVFCMLTGSYYLYTRTKIGGPDTFWLSFIIALRVGMVMYNITFLYVPYLGGVVHPPFWSFLAGLIITFNLMNWLLNRRTDISIDRTKRYLRYRLDGMHDKRLLKTVKSNTSEEVRIMDKEALREPLSQPIRSKFRRVLYVASSILSFVVMLVVLDLILRFSGWMGWISNYGEYLVFKEEAALGFMISFGVILFFLGLSMALIFKAFDSSDEIPY